MPLLQISGVEAKNRLGTEGARIQWPAQGSAGERLDGFTKVSSSPSFQISPDDKVFTAGSCFARNIERRLSEIGFSTVMHSQGIRKTLSALGESWPFLNKYNVSSILAELRWACGLDPRPEDELLLPLPNGNVLDLHFNPRSKAGVPIEAARETRAFVSSLFRRLPECQVVIMTLGLVEVWRDLRSGLRLNVAPLGAIDDEPDRFVLEVLSYEDILTDLEEIHALLSTHGHPDFRILITVSPVPLKMTFRAMDVLTANCYSKSVQRAAVEAFVAAHVNVDYFPSYETVTLTDRRLSFEADNRHVQANIVSKFVDGFISDYAPDFKFEQIDAPLAESGGPDGPRVQDVLGAANVQMAKGEYANAARLFATCVDRFPGQAKVTASAEFRLKYGTCLLKAGLPEAGMVQTELAAAAPDATVAILLKCTDRFIGYGNTAAARRAVATAAKKGAAAPDLMWHQARVAMAEDTPEQAVDLAKDLLLRTDISDAIRRGAEELVRRAQTVSKQFAAE